MKNIPLLSALVIDDEEDICFLLKNILGSMGFVAVGAGTLKEGFKNIKSIKHDVVFLDINLPDGSGLEAIEEIKNRNKKNGRIIIISAFDSTTERKIAVQKGADYFIGKPLTKNKISTALISTGFFA